MKVLGSLTQVTRLELEAQTGPGKVTLRAAAAAANDREFEFPTTGTAAILLTADSDAVLSNKEIDATANTITNLTEANLAGQLPYSALDLDGSILNSDLAGNISFDKLAALNPDIVAVTDANGQLTSSLVSVSDLQDVTTNANLAALANLDVEIGIVYQTAANTFDKVGFSAVGDGLTLDQPGTDFVLTFTPGNVDINNFDQILGVAKGGTGLDTVPANALLVGNGTGALVPVPNASAAGQLLVSTAGSPEWTDDVSDNITFSGGLSTNQIISPSGTLTIPGNLVVQGTTTTVNSTVVDIADKNITLNKGGDSLSAQGGGISVEGDSGAIIASLEYDAGSDSGWKMTGPGGVDTQVVGENVTQQLSNKTLISATLDGTTTPTTLDGTVTGSALETDLTVSAATDKLPTAAATKSYVETFATQTDDLTDTNNGDTLAEKTRYIANTSGGAFTVNLPVPSAANKGKLIDVVDSAGTFDVNALSVVGNINGAGNTLELDIANSWVTFISNGNTWFYRTQILGNNAGYPVVDVNPGDNVPALVGYKHLVSVAAAPSQTVIQLPAPAPELKGAQLEIIDATGSFTAAPGGPFLNVTGHIRGVTGDTLTVDVQWTQLTFTCTGTTWVFQ